MSGQIAVRSVEVGSGARWRWRSRWLAALAAFALVAVSVLVGVPQAWAGSHGVGYETTSGYFIGAYNTDVDGRQAYCIDIGAGNPFDQTSGPQTVTSLDSLSRQALAELNYVLARWGQSGDPDVTSAVALFVWSVADAQVYESKGGQDHYLLRAPSAHRAAIAANLAMMRAEATANAVVDPSLSLGVSMSDQYTGTLTVVATPANLSGPVQLTGGVFDDGSTTRTAGSGTYPVHGTPTGGAPSYRIAASMSADAAGYGAKVDLYVTPGAQRLIASVAASSSTGLSASAQTPVIGLDFQPQITTQVASRFVGQGASFTDRLTVSVTKGSWVELGGAPVPIQAVGTLYGPFDVQPAELASPPMGAPVAGTATLTLNSPGSYVSPSTLRATRSGFYVWVWRIDKDTQGQYGTYLTSSFADRFARVAETSVVAFQPVLTSQVNARLVNAGQVVSDTITVSSDNGSWLRVNGAFVPVTFEATVLQVPGTRPATTCGGPVATALPSAAEPTVIATVTLTANGPGTYTSPAVTLPSSGFVTWVWRVAKADQPATWRDYIAGDWQDAYGLADETTSVRWPVATASLVREYNVHPGGRAFDTVELSGFPADHGQYAGDACWGGDVDEVQHVVYGPFPSASVLNDDLDLTDAPVLTTLTTPARNGVYELGWSDDAIVPTEPGYYVVVSAFAGDDRVLPYRSSPADVRERFYVPPIPTGETPVSVITQATPTALVGELFDDLALVQGSTIPAGARLVFRAYGPQPADREPVCVEPFYESDPVPVTRAGIYRSGTTSVDQPGDVHWVETLYDEAGQVIAEGVCGAPGETTVVTQAESFTVTTRATATIEQGEEATDTAIVAGTVPAGASVVFRAYRQDGDTPTCTLGELAFTSEPVALDGPGEYVGEPFVFDEPGSYHWVETVYDKAGAVIHRGVCGAPDETTTVTQALPPTPTPAPPVPTPTPPAPTPTPPVPTPTTPAPTPTPVVPELARTGGGDWLLPLGIMAGIFTLAGACTLWFGRRLAIYRERTGYVREEDRIDGSEPEPERLDP